MVVHLLKLIFINLFIKFSSPKVAECKNKKIVSALCASFYILTIFLKLTKLLEKCQGALHTILIDSWQQISPCLGPILLKIHLFKTHFQPHLF